MTACSSAASSGDSLFEGPSIPVGAPESSCVAAQPANVSSRITSAANGIAAASRLGPSTYTSLHYFEVYSTSLPKSTNIKKREVTVQKSRVARQEPCSITAAPP